jgi:hypothetical protein
LAVNPPDLEVAIKMVGASEAPLRISYSYRELAMRRANAVETTSLISRPYRELGSTRLRNLILVGCVGVVGFMTVVGFVAFRLAQECEVTLTITHGPFDPQRRDNELSEIAAVGIRPSSDAWALFEEFAKRFSLIETSNKQDRIRDIQSIAKAGGGDRNELVFVLRTLFRWNDIDAEWVEVYGSPETTREQDRAKVIRDLVLVPVLDRIFDPALPPTGQHKGSGRALLDGVSRIHYDGMIFTTFQCRGSRIP